MVDNTLAYVLAAVVVIFALAYKKYRGYISNVPSLGALFFTRRQKKTADDLKKFAEENNAKLVHGFFDWKSWMFITHPDSAQIMLRDEETFQKYDDNFGPLKTLMKDSLVNQNGEAYKEMKEIMSPAFHYEFIKKMVPNFILKSNELFSTWDKNPTDLNVYSDMSHYTLDALGLGAFGIDFKACAGGNHDYLKAYGTLINPRQQATAKARDAAIKALNVMTQEIVNDKSARKKKDEGADILDRLLASKEKLTTKKITDNTFLLFIAGHETTSHALEWGMYFLAKYPEMQQVARDEVDKQLKGETPNGDNIKSLPYLDMFIKEVMRTKPPVANMLSRITTKDAQVGDYLVPKNTKIGISIYTIHHLAEFWEEPYKFDPLRFSPERSVGRHPFAYLPFSLGRRNCIGNNFSILEQKIFLAMLLQRYVITMSDKCVAFEYPVFQVCWPAAIKVNVTKRSVDGANQI